MTISSIIIITLVSAVFAGPQLQTSQRIIGGFSTVIEEYPYTASLLLSTDNVWSHTCGGILITSRNILSAAQCFYDNRVSTLWRARLGSSFRSFGGRVYQAAKLVLHEDFDHVSFVNDIAILSLDTSAILSNSVQVARLPPPGFNVPDNQLITAVGWGALIQLNLDPEEDPDDVPYPEQLQHVDITVVNQQICADRYFFLNTVLDWLQQIKDGMFCSGILNSLEDTCKGDIGGPVVLKAADGHVVIGITSFAVGCGSGVYPRANVNTSYYSDWIVKHGSVAV